MPSYKVTEKGFKDGKIYDPNGKRKVLHVDKPLKPVPSWLEPIKAETSTEKRKRLAKEKKDAAAAEKKAKQDKKDIDDMTFMGEGEKATSSVETL